MDNWVLGASEEEDSEKKERYFTVGSTGLRGLDLQERDCSLCPEDEYKHIDHNNTINSELAFNLQKI